MKTIFDKAKHKVLIMGQGNSKHQYRLDDKYIESNPEEKDLEMWVDERVQHDQAICACNSEGQ